MKKNYVVVNTDPTTGKIYEAKIAKNIDELRRLKACYSLKASKDDCTFRTLDDNMYAIYDGDIEIARIQVAKISN